MVVGISVPGDVVVVVVVVSMLSNAVVPAGESPSANSASGISAISFFLILIAGVLGNVANLVGYVVIRDSTILLVDRSKASFSLLVYPLSSEPNVGS